MKTVLLSLFILINISFFAQTRDIRSKDQANVFWNGEYPLYSLTSDKQILPNDSGEFVFWGTTNENPVPTEFKLTKGQRVYVYKFIDYQECLLFCNEVRKAKGLKLLEVPSQTDKKIVISDNISLIDTTFNYPKNESELLKKYYSFEDKWTGIEYLKYVIKNTTASDTNSILIFAYAHLFKIIDQSVYFYKSTLISQEEWNSNYEMLSMFPANLIQKGEGKRAFYLFAFIVCGQKTNNNTIQYWKAILEEFNSENCPLGAEFYAQCKKVTDEYSNNLKLAEEKQAKVNSDNLLKSQLLNYFSQGVTNGIKEAKENFELIPRKIARESQPQISNNTSISNSTPVKSKMHVYVCDDCGKIQTSESRPYDKSTCPETRWGGIGGAGNLFDDGDHAYTDIGNSGSQQFVCRQCNISIMIYQKPTNEGACGAGGSNCCNHQWNKN